MYIGRHLPNENPYEDQTFVKVPQEIKFAVTNGADGKFESLTMPSGLNTGLRNLIKGWANMLQIAVPPSGQKAFKSNEVSIALGFIKITK